MDSKPLRIGEVAARVGVNPKTLRFYEATGLLPPPSRGENGYRFYPPETVDLLGFIKAAQGLGLTLGEIKEIITIRRAGRPPCVHVRDLLAAKARELDRKLRDLVALRRRIRQSLAAWGRRPRNGGAVCPHIERDSPSLSADRRGRARKRKDEAT